MRGRTDNLIGMKFGRLVVLSRNPVRQKHTNFAWFCKCDCGNIVSVVGSNLNRPSRATRSCGCLSRETARLCNRRHGLTKTKLYRAWAMLKSRCLNPADKGYINYGGRGITVHAAWSDDFELFAKEIPPMPEGRYSIDRIDNNKGYEPGNIQWATTKQQTRNMRKNVWITARGETRIMTDWETFFGLSQGCIRHLTRIRNCTYEEAVSYYFEKRKVAA